MTLWSEVIWDKLGRRDIKLHEHTAQELTIMVMEWVKKSSKKEIIDTIEDLGIPITKNVDWYDGPFHRLGNEKHGWHVHDSEVLPIVIGIFLAFPGLLKNIDLVKDIANNYHAKGETE